MSFAVAAPSGITRAIGFDRASRNSFDLVANHLVNWFTLWQLRITFRMAQNYPLVV